MSFDILVRCFSSKIDWYPCFPVVTSFAMWHRSCWQKRVHDVEDHYSLIVSDVLPRVCYPPARHSLSHNSEEEKNEKSKVLVCFYPMY
jgi:hypothetical protein